MTALASLSRWLAAFYGGHRGGPLFKQTHKQKIVLYRTKTLFPLKEFNDFLFPLSPNYAVEGIESVKIGWLLCKFHEKIVSMRKWEIILTDSVYKLKFCKLVPFDFVYLLFECQEILILVCNRNCLLLLLKPLENWCDSNHFCTHEWRDQTWANYIENVINYNYKLLTKKCN